jgi:hypothetical protein
MRILLPANGDDVALAGRVAADGVVLCAAADVDPIAAVAQVGRAVDIRADIVAGNGVARRAAAVDFDAILGVAGDEVALAGRVAADSVVRCAWASTVTIMETDLRFMEFLLPATDSAKPSAGKRVATAPHQLRCRSQGRWGAGRRQCRSSHSRSHQRQSPPSQGGCGSRRRQRLGRRPPDWRLG